MNRIADAVELNRATPYLHFKSKETPLAAVVLRGVQSSDEKSPGSRFEN